ncbi:arginine deiminase [Weissella viridescens]|uniref:arginine deiminase n=1 Tax=Weissella viridescens TaxID=1629 RepID=UPI001C7D1439|nr:arginine deiminase [Weissella viridescens]MBX4173322.1 arginine deiminase [Weissella viridescens]
MIKQPAIQVNSEIGTLREVLLHRPGAEIENITPDTMERLLFDDIPFLKNAQAEHDAFADLLRERGAEVVYIEQLLAECLQSADTRIAFIKRYLEEHHYTTGTVAQEMQKYLQTLSVKDLVQTIYAGIRRDALDLKYTSLDEVAGTAAEDLFLMDPLPNAYFTRDPQASIGNGMTINHMTYAARQPESLITEFVMAHHPRFSQRVPIWLDRNQDNRIEGGDELVLNEHTLAIGISQRTSSKAVQMLAEHLFASPDSHIDTIMAVEIPHNHAMMHLDTVFTMVNTDQFTVFPGIMDDAGKMNINLLRANNQGEVVLEHRDNLKRTLLEVLNLDDLDLIETGNGDPINAAREQWNDGSNNLAIAPGEVVTYDRNYISIQLMREHGITVHEIKSSELSRGRGGARCMSQPLWRDELN